jgi:RNase P subunit RPR2
MPKRNKILMPRVPERWRTARKKAIEMLGGKCVRCGFTDWRALQFDHIKGKVEVPRPHEHVWQTLRKVLSGDFEGLQLLCSNCNWIKRYENGEATNRPRRDVQKFVSIIVPVIGGDDAVQ